MGIAQNHLPTSKHRSLPPGYFPHLVAAVRQFIDRRRWYPLFQSHLPARDPIRNAEARHVKRRLGVKPLFQGKEYLQVPLRLHKATHHSHRSKEGIIRLAGDQSRDNGVVRTFTGRKRIRMAWLQAEI